MDEKKIFEDVELKEEEILTEETLDEFTGEKGDE